MKTEFTKGKWTVQNRFEKNEFGVFSLEIDVPESHQSSIASIWGNASGVDAEAHANAKLIAAAPTLIEALQLVVDRIESDWHLIALPEQYGLKTALLAEAKQAIKKATE